MLPCLWTLLRILVPTGPGPGPRVPMVLHKIAQKKRDILFFLNIHELYSYILLNKIIMFIYIPDT